ncbi:hypothetical protein L596_007181 [Steinernema carpocapsae]|uniref:Uncharacterized protein n=1 Tax=Steinernema carpocapsae TaxID=34508 RepID=A0A4U5P967_STECR|nr:hypothetical protein L596_007181 [Steinernema carpocapsae]
MSDRRSEGLRQRFCLERSFKGGHSERAVSDRCRSVGYPPDALSTLNTARTHRSRRSSRSHHRWSTRISWSRPSRRSFSPRPPHTTEAPGRCSTSDVPTSLLQLQRLLRNRTQEVQEPI